MIDGESSSDELVTELIARDLGKVGYEQAGEDAAGGIFGIDETAVTVLQLQHHDRGSGAPPRGEAQTEREREIA